VTFLTPIPAIIAACICVPVLLALYLLKLRRRPVRVGSVLFWPRASEDTQANVPLRMIRPSWLLLLHVLALAGLLLAFARPAMMGDARDSQRVVLLIDNSASMSAVDESGQPSRLERAKQRAKELVREHRSITGSRSVAVVSFALTAEARSGFTSASSVATAAIDAIEPTDQPGDMAAALGLVESLAQTVGEGDSETPREPPSVVLLSDGSFSAAEEMPQARVAVRFERVGPAPERVTQNVGITAYAVRRDATNLRKVRVFARVMSVVGGVDVPLTLALDGVALERRAVRVEASEETDGNAPAEVEVTWELDDVPAGVLTLVIDQDDALASDNLASAVLPPPTAPRVALVREQLVSGGERDARLLLSDVLEELRPQSILVFAPDEFARAMQDAEFASGIDLLVLDGVATGLPRGVPTLSFGPVPRVAGLIGGEQEPVRVASVFWNREHPLMRGVTLDALTVARSWIAAVDEAAMQAGATRLDVVARSDDRALVMLADTADAEHVIVTFDVLESNWPLQAGFPVFVANATDYLTRRSQRINAAAFTTAQIASVNLPRTSGVTISGSVDITPPGLAEQAPGVISLGHVPRAGVYVVRGGAATGDRGVAINVANATESLLASPASVMIDGRPVASIQSGRGQREVWHWFVLAALGLLAVEWLVYAARVRA
jgi:hypothetical protein